MPDSTCTTPTRAAVERASSPFAADAAFPKAVSKVICANRFLLKPREATEKKSPFRKFFSWMSTTKKGKTREAYPAELAPFLGDAKDAKAAFADHPLVDYAGGERKLLVPKLFRGAAGQTGGVVYAVTADGAARVPLAHYQVNVQTLNFAVRAFPADAAPCPFDKGPSEAAVAAVLKTEPLVTARFGHTEAGAEPMYRLSHADGSQANVHRVDTEVVYHVATSLRAKPEPVARQAFYTQLNATDPPVAYEFAPRRGREGAEQFGVAMLRPSPVAGFEALKLASGVAALNAAVMHVAAEYLR